ncbi:hypothetical protein BH11MYX3_BH11MYX3_19090 [soil metagenome]
MADDSITVKVLTELRDDVRELRTDVRELSTDVRSTNARVDHTSERLEQIRLELKGELKSELVGVEARIATRQIARRDTAATGV